MVTMAFSSTSSCSPPQGGCYKLRTTPARRNPPEGRRYELRKTPARHNPIKMDRSRANWNENTTKTFLNLCIAEKVKLNYNSTGLTKTGWQNVYHNFKSRTGRAYDIKQLQNKFNGLKRMFNLWKKLKDKSGGRWDNKAKTITCNADWCENEIAENSNAKQFFGKLLAFKDELTILFETPPEAMYHSGGGSVTKRFHSVAGSLSPGKRALSMSIEQTLDNLGNCIQKVKERTDKSDNFSDEMDTVTKTLAEDGYTETDDMWIRTLALCHNKIWRLMFLTFKSPQGRAKWVETVWDKTLNL